MTQTEHIEEQLREYIKLAKLAFILVRTSMNDERAYNAMSFLKKPEANALDRNLKPAVAANHQG